MTTLIIVGAILAIGAVWLVSQIRNAPELGNDGKFHYKGENQRLAVVVGLTHVDPRAYNGWKGDCPGCDVDAKWFAAHCEKHGIKANLLLNDKATRGNVLWCMRQVMKKLSKGDLVTLYVSSHGGQIKDKNGDEEDGQDETLCLWDGELVDDLLYELWREVPVGVRVFFVTDTCNSGTNYRHRPVQRTLPVSYAGSLIHYGGAADGESSIGAADGGYFTNALRGTWKDGITYADWFKEAKSHIKGKQVPVYAEFGVTDDFRNRSALT